LSRRVPQELLEAEMTEALGAEKGVGGRQRAFYRAGYYDRTLVTRVGKLELRVPQDRHGRFSTELFERYKRSQKALVAALAEMYVQGVSTRKVKAITAEQTLELPDALLELAHPGGADHLVVGPDRLAAALGHPLPPFEQQARRAAVLARHERHRHARLERLLDQPDLLRHRPPPAALHPR
jgi:hypothetical protein